MGPVAPPVTVLAVGREGWVVAERRLDHGLAGLVEDAADALRSVVRNDTGWEARILVIDAEGRDVTARFMDAV
jgi:hypothetical protein